MGLIQDVKKEAKQNKKKENKGSNLVLDLILQGLSAGTLIALAGYEMLRHIEAAYPVNLILASIGIGFLLYNIIAPFYRHK